MSGDAATYLRPQTAKRARPAFWPPLADELMARFRKNQLEMLSIDFLMAIRAVIA